MRLDQIEGKTTRRSHFRQVEKQTGRIVDELHPDPPPECALHIWAWFADIRNSYDGSVPVPPSEVEAWCRLTGNTLLPWEYRAIRQLDKELMSIRAEEVASG